MILLSPLQAPLLRFPLAPFQMRFSLKEAFLALSTSSIQCSCLCSRVFFLTNTQVALFRFLFLLCHCLEWVWFARTFIWEFILSYLLLFSLVNRHIPLIWLSHLSPFLKSFFPGRFDLLLEALLVFTPIENYRLSHDCHHQQHTILRYGRSRSLGLAFRFFDNSAFEIE